MKKKFLSFILAICLIIPCAFSLTACGDNPPKDPPATVTYTVTEEEWKTNLNLTKSQTQTQLLASSSQPLTQITSYTVRAEGVNAGQQGSGVLKMASNGMYTEFYPNGVDLDPRHSGTYDNTQTLYQSMKINMMRLVPFAENYDDFTFDETKNAYVAQNITATLVNDYNINETENIYHKSAEVSFVNGVLHTVSFEMSDKTSVENDNNFDNIIATFTFTFSNINNTSVDI